jgi:delta8-fatty-acid desaturase
MEAYQIGQVEGLWENFLPPIQGGHFRPYLEDDEKAQNDDESFDLSSSQNSSRSSTPSLDGLIPLIRRRGPRNAAESPSLSSISSLSSSSVAEYKAETIPSYIDAWTKREIDLDLSAYPPLDPVTQDEIVQKYRLLHDRIKAEGLYKCHYVSYLTELCRYILLFSLCLLFLRWRWYGTSGMFLGLFWHQLVFTAHDAGHMGITHDFTMDTIIGIIIADFWGGLSLGWWKKSHNVSSALLHP